MQQFSWRTEDGRRLLGRTYDQFGDLTANRVISVPQRIPCAPGLHGEGAVPGEYSYTGIAVLHRIAVRGAERLCQRYVYRFVQRRGIRRAGLLPVLPVHGSQYSNYACPAVRYFILSGLYPYPLSVNLTKYHVSLDSIHASRSSKTSWRLISLNISWRPPG